MKKKNLKLVGGPETLSDTVGGRIQKARVARGLSTSQLARRIGVLSKTIRNWETDKSEPRTSKIQKIAGVLSVPPLWLIGGDINVSEIFPVVNTDETANLENKIGRLLALHQESAKLIFELQSEVLRLQGEIESGSLQLKPKP